MKKSLIIIVCSFVLMLQSFAQYHNINKPIHLLPNKNEIILEDFYLESDKIKFAKLLESGKMLPITAGKIIIDNKDLNSFIDFVKITTNHNNFVIPVYKSSKRDVEFSFIPKGKENYNNVAIAGSFNGWSKTANPLTKNGNQWTTSVLLNEGSYQYQMVCDGESILDPNNNKKTPNGFGAFNSILEVKANGKVPLLQSERIVEESSVVRKASNTVNRMSRNIETSKSKVRLNFKINSEGSNNVFVLWENEIIDTKKLSGESSFSILIPEKANAMNRSYVRVLAFNENGRGNDILVPLENGKAIKYTKDLIRQDVHQNIMYFVMVDRFNNANRRNDFPLKDKRVDKRADYFGGDLQGITEKYEEGYFKDLGINTLWISPITDNVDGAYQEYPEPKRFYSGYHGYWPKNNMKVDEHFGDMEDFQELVEVVHQNDNNIILDFVSNHVHEEHALIQNNPSWKTDLRLPNGDMNIRIWDEHRLTTWFDTFLPTLDYSNPDVVETMVDTAYFWLNKFSLDGFRHDATKHIPNEFWRALTKKLKQNYLTEYNSVYQIGETFGNRELIGSYLGNGLLDAQFDFNLYFDIRDVLLQDDQSFERVAKSLNESIAYYGSNSLMGNITGNHDLPRFMGYASEAFTFDEDPKEVGWERNVEMQNKTGYKKLSLLHALVTTLPGIPCIYYGDEIGMVGANDPDNRRPMKFDKLSGEEKRTKETLKQLIKVRKQSIAFLFGTTEVLFADKDAMVLMRKYFDKVAIVAYNKSGKNKSINFDLNFRNMRRFKTQFETNSGNKQSNVYFDLPAYGFEVLLSE